MPDTNQNHAPERREPQAGGKPRAKRKRRRRPVLLTILIRLFQALVTLLLIGIITGCFMACFAVVYVRTVVMPKTYLNLDDYAMDENSVIYYEDKDTHELVPLQTLVGKENRELVKYEDIPEDLINAFVAIEDKRFWKHQGVDWMGTAAGLSKLFTGGNIRGGSTITQQLIKNLTDRDEVTVNRKILEIFTALELENNYDKNKILTTYLNYIYLGNGCSGVQAASKFYFGKDVSDLTLAECASLAGITNNPSLYAPRGVVDVMVYQCQECKKTSTTKDSTCWSCGAENSYDNGSIWTNREFNKARQELILKEMAKEDKARDDTAYITEAERDAAIAQPLVFAWDSKASPDDPEDPEGGGEDSKPSTVNSWYVEAVISEAIQSLMESTRLSEKACSHRVYSGGLSIIAAYDPDVQAAVDSVFNNRENLDQVSKRTGQRLMSAISVVDNRTGYVVAMGSTQEKTVNRGWNVPVDTKRQPGSSIKPLSVYSPALEMGLITPATVVDDSPQELNGKPWPVNVTPTYKGLTTILDGVTNSLNTVAVRVLQQVTPQVSFDYMTQRYGITSMVSYLETSTGQIKSDIELSPLSMGGLTRGVSTFEMAAAFATFPRDGAFSKATTVLEIRDANGSVVLDNKPETNFVIQPKTAYYMNALLTNAVNSGTGTGARISGQTVAGKTGTTSDTYDYWFCGYTSYYTAAVWTGYPTNEVINTNYYNPSVTLWKKVMEPLHEGLENAAFTVPGTLNTYNICKDCGKKALSECENDTRGSRIQVFRLFAEDAPMEFCDCHKPVRICVDSPILNENGEAVGGYHLAGEFCPEETVKTVYAVDFQREVPASARVGDSSALLSHYEGVGTCTVHTDVPEPSAPVEPSDPMPSGDPFWSWPPFPGPDDSEQPIVPPTAEPWPTADPWPSAAPYPTFDPLPTTDPWPSVDPYPSQTYVPADDDFPMPDWLRPH